MSTLLRSEILYFQRILMSVNSILSVSSVTFAINGSTFHLMTTFKPCRSGCNTVRLAKGMPLRHVQTRSFYLPVHTLVTTDVTHSAVVLKMFRFQRVSVHLQFPTIRRRRNVRSLLHLNVRVHRLKQTRPTHVIHPSVRPHRVLPHLSML